MLSSSCLNFSHRDTFWLSKSGIFYYGQVKFCESGDRIFPGAITLLDLLSYTSPAKWLPNGTPAI